MYTDVVTVFNRYRSANGDIWYPHMLSGVDLIVDASSMIAKYGTETADRAKLHIKYNHIDNNIVVGELKYMPPKEWENLLNDDLKYAITFNDDATYFDFFIEGPWDGSDVIIDDDYMDGFLAHMEEQTECYAITSVGKYKAIPHFEIVGR